MTRQAMEMKVARQQTPGQKNYTQEQVSHLIGLKEHTIRWLNHERQNLEMRGTELRNRLSRINQALSLIQRLSNERKDLAVFEMMKL